MTVKANKAQLHKIAEELVGPLLAQQRQEHQEAIGKAVRASQEATEALKAERARVATWRQRIEAESKDMHATIREFRAELAALRTASAARDAAQDRATEALDQRLAEVDKRLSGLLSERGAVDDMKRLILSEWMKLDAELKHTAVRTERALKQVSQKEHESISAAGQQVVSVASAARADFRSAVDEIKSVAKKANININSVVKRLHEVERLDRVIGLIHRLDKEFRDG